MSNEVTFTGRVASVKQRPIAQNATGDWLGMISTVKVGTLVFSGDDIEFEFTTFRPGCDPMDAPVRVTVRFPEGWEVQA